MTFTNATTPYSAKLTLDDAVQHLYHFCATLPASPYVDSTPIFMLEAHSSGGDEKCISAQVLLPTSVDVSVRSACSKSLWITEKMARKDAAFEAYKALYHAGLVNDNLLPFVYVDAAVDEAYSDVEKRPSIVKVSDLIDVWPSLVQFPGHSYGSLVRITGQDQITTDMIMLLPGRMPAITGTTNLYWDRNTTFQLDFSPETATFSPAVTASAARITFLLLESVFRGRVDCGRYDFTASFMPSTGIDHTDHQTWLTSHSGATRAEDIRYQDLDRDVGLVRDLSNHGTLHIFHDVRNTALEDTLLDGSSNILQNPSADLCLSDKWQCRTSEGEPVRGVQLDRIDPNQCVLMQVKKLPKRADFLHPVPCGNLSPSDQSGLQWLPAEKCEINKLPFSYSRFAMFIPSILHKVQVAMIAEHICSTVLSPLHFTDRSLVTTAISASSAHEATDYQRLETLGDSILKYTTSLTLIAEHKHYHEGIRTYFRRSYLIHLIISSLATCLGRLHFVDNILTLRSWSSFAQKRPHSLQRLACDCSYADWIKSIHYHKTIHRPQMAAAIQR